MSGGNDGGPASPGEYETADVFGGVNRNLHPGMSLRAYFVGQAMAGLLARTDRSWGEEDNARSAVRQADAAIRALQGPPAPTEREARLEAALRKVEHHAVDALTRLVAREALAEGGEQ